jgi:hypothetical protein
VGEPHDQIADAADDDNRQHLALHPVQVHQIGIGTIDAIRPIG